MFGPTVEGEASLSKMWSISISLQLEAGGNIHRDQSKDISKIKGIQGTINADTRELVTVVTRLELHTP